MSDHEPLFVADERTQLGTKLDEARAELVETLDGLTEVRARRRLVPSLTTPIALVKHATFVEQVWFHVGLAGCTREEIGLPTEVDDSYVVGPDETVASVIADYRRCATRPARWRRRTRWTTRCCTIGEARSASAGCTCT